MVAQLMSDGEPLPRRSITGINTYHRSLAILYQHTGDLFSEIRPIHLDTLRLGKLLDVDWQLIDSMLGTECGRPHPSLANACHWLTLLLRRNCWGFCELSLNELPDESLGTGRHVLEARLLFQNAVHVRPGPSL